MNYQLLKAGALFGFSAVVLGAAVRHWIIPQGPEQMAQLEIANDYHFFHALAILAVGSVSARKAVWRSMLGGVILVAGTILFSGSLYVRALWPDLTWISPITPLGGGMLVIGWLLLWVQFFMASRAQAAEE